MPALRYAVGNPGYIDFWISGSDVINVDSVARIMGLGEQVNFVRGGHDRFKRKANAFFDQRPAYEIGKG